jgi:hypothetical protein
MKWKARRISLRTCVLAKNNFLKKFRGFCLDLRLGVMAIVESSA